MDSCFVKSPYRYFSTGEKGWNREEVYYRYDEQTGRAELFNANNEIAPRFKDSSWKLEHINQWIVSGQAVEVTEAFVNTALTKWKN